MYVEVNRNLDAVYNCQHLIEHTKHTLSQTFLLSFLPSKVYTSTFIKRSICHANDKTFTFFPLIPPPPTPPKKNVFVYTQFNIYNYGQPLRTMLIVIQSIY